MSKFRNWTPTFAALLGLILIGGQAAAWHEEDEVENRRFGALAGDPRVLEDAKNCLEETRNLEDVACVVLYAHLGGQGGEIPMTVQPPPECASGGMSGSMIPWEGNNHVLFFSSVFVQYGEGDESGTCMPTKYGSGGSHLTIELDQDSNVHGHWFLSSSAHRYLASSIDETGHDHVPEAGAIPCLTLAMGLEAGHQRLEGDVLAMGNVTKTVISTPGGLGQEPPVPDPCPGSSTNVTTEEVSEFQVDLGKPKGPINAREGITARVQWHQYENSALTSEEIPDAIQPGWKQEAGSEYTNRIILPVQNALEIYELAVVNDQGTRQRQIEDGLSIRVGVRSPFGQHDVDLENIQIQLIDRAGKPVPLGTLEEPHAYDTTADDSAVSGWILTYPWNPDLETIEHGEYTLQVAAPNWQHTAIAKNETSLTRGGEMQNDLSGASAIVILVCILIATARYRRLG